MYLSVASAGLSMMLAKEKKLYCNIQLLRNIHGVHIHGRKIGFQWSPKGFTPTSCLFSNSKGFATDHLFVFIAHKENTKLGGSPYS